MGELTATAVSKSASPAARVECPTCEKRRYVGLGRYLCSRCGTWFDVRPTGGDGGD